MEYRKQEIRALRAARASGEEYGGRDISAHAIDLRAEIDRILADFGGPEDDVERALDEIIPEMENHFWVGYTSAIVAEKEKDMLYRAYVAGCEMRGNDISERDIAYAMEAEIASESGTMGYLQGILRYYFWAGYHGRFEAANDAWWRRFRTHCFWMQYWDMSISQTVLHRKRSGSYSSGNTITGSAMMPNEVEKMTEMKKYSEREKRILTVAHATGRGYAEAGVPLEDILDRAMAAFLDAFREGYWKGYEERYGTKKMSEYMKYSTEKMMEKLDERHDFARGQAYGHGGTSLSRCDRCRVCGLEREWYTDPQNGITEEYRYVLRGTSLSLRDALKRPCAGDEYE